MHFLAHVSASLIEKDDHEVRGGSNGAEGLELRAQKTSRQGSFSKRAEEMGNAGDEGASAHQHECVVRMNDVAGHRHERKARHAPVPGSRKRKCLGPADGGRATS